MMRRSSPPFAKPSRTRSSKPPGAVLEHVLSALRQADAKLIG